MLTTKIIYIRLNVFVHKHNIFTIRVQTIAGQLSYLCDVSIYSPKFIVRKIAFYPRNLYNGRKNKVVKYFLMEYFSRYL